MKLQAHYLIRALIIFFIFTALCGCSLFKDLSENISGNYMKGLQKEKAKSKSQVFDYGIEECFVEVLGMLEGKKISVEILKIDYDNYSILALVSRGEMLEQADSTFDANTADVGIFFTEQGSESTKIEVRSLSSLFVDYTAEKIFSELEKKK